MRSHIKEHSLSSATDTLLSMLYQRTFMITASAINSFENSFDHKNCKVLKRITTSIKCFTT